MSFKKIFSFLLKVAITFITFYYIFDKLISGRFSLNVNIFYSKTILFLIFVYFIIENITRIDWYLKRYDIWPPIEKGIILERKKI